MTEERWSTVDRYFSDRLLPNDPVLTAALKAAADAGLPEISVSPNQGMMLQILAKTIHARSVLEIGTLAGYSTICLARGMDDDGKLITLEIDSRHAEVARANIARAGFSRLVELIEGKALEILPVLAKKKRGPFDLIFIDADKENIPNYFEWSLKLSRPGTLIIVDNVVRDGRVSEEDADDAAVTGVRKFVEMLKTERRVNATAIQTVGVKGYDGFAIVRVNS